MKHSNIIFLLMISCIIISCNKNSHILDNKDISINDIQSAPNLSLLNSAEENLISAQMYCSDKTVALCAGPELTVGTVTVKSDFDGKIYVTYNVTGDWFLSELNLYVGDQETLPVTNSGSPIASLFPHSKKFSNPNTQEFTFVISNLPPSFIVSAYASVLKSSNGQQESVWGDGCGVGMVNWN